MSAPDQWIAAALKHRAIPGDTDVRRIVHGSADGFPGLFIDDFAGRWLAQSAVNPPPGWLAEQMARSIYYKQLDVGTKTAPQHLAGERISEPFLVRENGLVFEIDFASGYSQGLFTDQRENRGRVRRIASGRRVLNTFAYTCAFGVAVAAGGGTVLDLDLSRPYLAWGARNYRHNGLPAQDSIFGDVFDWLTRFRRKGRVFDFVILDPPTFSRTPDGKVFRVEKHYSDLVALAAGVLSDEGGMLCCTNQRGLAPEVFHRLVRSGLPPRLRDIVRPLPMPAEFRGDNYLKTLWVGHP